jgi:hypothetical protein
MDNIEKYAGNKFDYKKQELENRISLLEKSLLTISTSINNPNELEPVLAEISHVNDLGVSTWYEVVYYFDKWCSYSGSKTFEDGEQVVKWKYCKDCL